MSSPTPPESPSSTPSCSRCPPPLLLHLWTGTPSGPCAPPAATCTSTPGPTRGGPSAATPAAAASTPSRCSLPVRCPRDQHLPLLLGFLPARLPDLRQVRLETVCPYVPVDAWQRRSRQRRRRDPGISAAGQTRNSYSGECCCAVGEGYEEDGEEEGG
ncbi:uncharacterized protein M6B38_313170 [Iris pallida]|uniref:Uncharacterized protein n=1 Tax=Iris pallida TaxID=29817 RepID=A0AAX6HFG0_IRIPA|nr:uncharacterized protein M6B38_313170 [Iris pallida]